MNEYALTKKNEEFLQEVQRISGEIITNCMQCGTCSGSCPMVKFMDISPSQMIFKTVLGLPEVLDAKTVWLCASCFTCSVRCPRGIDIAKVADALRQMKVRQAIERINLRQLPQEELASLPVIALVSSGRKFT